MFEIICVILGIIFVVIYQYAIYLKHKKFAKKRDIEVLRYEPKEGNKHVIRVVFKLNMNGERREFCYGINVYRIIRDSSSWYEENPAEFVIFAEMTKDEQKQQILKTLQNYQFLLRLLIMIEESDTEDKADKYWNKMLKED